MQHMETHRVCPWWIGSLMASPIRKLFDSPYKLLEPYVSEGMTVLEPGPGMGFFTLELARLVGASGRVIAVDVQSRMLDGLRRRALKAGIADRLETRLASADSLGVADLQGAVDFTAAIAVVHEMPSAERFFTEVARASKVGGRLLFLEPKGHVSEARFEAEFKAASDAGFQFVESPSGGRGHKALLRYAPLR